MTDEDIAAAVAKDPDAAPIRSYEYIMEHYKLVLPRIIRQ